MVQLDLHELAGLLPALVGHERLSQGRDGAVSVSRTQLRAPYTGPWQSMRNAPAGCEPEERCRSETSLPDRTRQGPRLTGWCASLRRCNRGSRREKPDVAAAGRRAFPPDPGSHSHGGDPALSFETARAFVVLGDLIQ